MTTGKHTGHDPLAALSHGEGDTLRQLHTRLAEDAASEGLLDVAYRTVDSPLGPLLVAATDGGLVRVAYEREGHEGVLESLAERVSPRILQSPGRLDTVAQELGEYFAGSRTAFDLSLDLRLVRGFRREVLARLGHIGYGTTMTYAAVADLVGNSKAVRAVGSACSNNPVPIVVPCHRVVRTDGGDGGYVGGPHAKRILLDLESASA